MGCDGGTIPRRDELVRTKKKPEQKDKNSELAFKWKHCAISQEVLSRPIVACELGRLYNKESVLEFFLDKTKFDVAEQFDHLRGLKDVKELNLTDNPEKKPRSAETGDGYIDVGVSDFICPVVGVEMSGKHRFCFLWSCGCALSERALREVKCEVCHKCGKAFNEEDIVVLNGTEEDVDVLRQKMDQRRMAAKLAKAAKKASKQKSSSQTTGENGKKTISPEASCSTSSPSTSSLPSSSHNGIDTNKSKLVGSSASKPGSSLIKNGKSSSVSNGGGIGKLIPKDDKKGEKRKAGSSSIQDDPRASKTFKSLFTTSEEARKQQKPHWVTFNPMYY